MDAMDAMVLLKNTVPDHNRYLSVGVPTQQLTNHLAGLIACLPSVVLRVCLRLCNIEFHFLVNRLALIGTILSIIFHFESVLGTKT